MIKFDTRKGNIAIMEFQIWRINFHFRAVHLFGQEFHLGIEINEYDWRLYLGFWALIADLSLQQSEVEK